MHKLREPDGVFALIKKRWNRGGIETSVVYSTISKCEEDTKEEDDVNVLHYIIIEDDECFLLPILVLLFLKERRYQEGWSKSWNKIFCDHLIARQKKSFVWPLDVMFMMTDDCEETRNARELISC